MSKFKVGDRVEIVDPVGVCAPDNLAGKFGVVGRVVTHLGEDDLYVTADGDDVAWCYGAEHLKLIESSDNRDTTTTTLTRRVHFAMAALTGLLMMREFGTYEGRVSDAFAIADLMEAARNKEGAE